MKRSRIRSRGFLKDEQIVTDKEGMSHFCYDATEMRFMPDVVLLPYSSEEVSRIIKLASKLNIPIPLRAGGPAYRGVRFLFRVDWYFPFSG